MGVWGVAKAATLNRTITEIAFNAEVKMQQGTITLIVAILGISGTFVSGVVIQHIARKSQQKQWLQDKQTQEYRELLDAFTIAYMSVVQISHHPGPGEVRRLDYEPPTSAIEVESYRVLRNRVFTAVDLERENMRVRWAEALENFKRTDDVKKFASRFDSICATIVWLATGIGHRPKVV